MLNFAITNIFFLFQEIEVCLTKEVTHVISDNPDITSTNSQGLPIGPPSPWTPSQTPSPATSTSAIDSTDRRKCPTGPNSRAEAIRARARTSARSDSSTSVLEKARRLGISDSNIWSLSKTLQWLLKYKAKYGFSKGSGSKEKSKSEKKQLVAPAIKLEEEASLNRPVYAELKSWPVLRFDGKPGSSPFSVPSSNSKQKVRKFARRVGISQAENNLKKKVEKKEVKKVRKSKSSGFCEICNTNFSQFEKHLESQQHKDFVEDPDNWSTIDKFSSGLSADLQSLNFYFSENSSQAGANSRESQANQAVFESSVEQESLRTPSQRD